MVCVILEPAGMDSLVNSQLAIPRCHLHVERLPAGECPDETEVGVRAFSLRKN